MRAGEKPGASNNAKINRFLAVHHSNTAGLYEIRPMRRVEAWAEKGYYCPIIRNATPGIGLAMAKKKAAKKKAATKKAAKKATKTKAVKKKAGEEDEAPVKKKKAKRKKKAPVIIRMKVFWGVFNHAMKRVALYDFNQRKAAEKRAQELTDSGKPPHFVMKVKEEIEEPKAEKAAKATKTTKKKKAKGTKT